jgi:hypothetical protein
MTIVFYDRRDKTNIEEDPVGAMQNCRAVLDCGAIPGGECFAGCDATLPEKITRRDPHPHLYCEKRPNLGKMLLAVQELRRQNTAQKKQKGKALTEARSVYKLWVKATKRRFSVQCTLCNKWRVSGRKATLAFTCRKEPHVVALAKVEMVSACEITCTRCNHAGARCTCEPYQSDSDRGDSEEKSQVEDSDKDQGSAGEGHQEDSDITDSENDTDEDSEDGSESSDDESGSDSEPSEPDLD